MQANSHQQTPQNAQSMLVEEEYTEAIDENFSSDIGSQVSPQTQEAQKPNAFQQFMSSLGGQPEAAAPALNPNNFTAVYSAARVINGDTLEIQGSYFRLYGIDAPEANQSCADRQGRSYNCGREAALWLKNWITTNELECHVMQQDAKGNMVGTCSLGQYDLGAALVNAGWAVAYQKYTDIYVPYERQAQMNKRGLWQGTFYMPWDWRAMQGKKPKIKVIKPKVRRKSILDL